MTETTKEVEVPTLTVEQARNALVFLARVDLKGAEMPALSSLVEALERIANQ